MFTHIKDNKNFLLMCLLNKTGVFGYFTTRDPIQICSLFTIILFFYALVIAASCVVVIVVIVVVTICYKIYRKYKRRNRKGTLTIEACYECD